MLRKCRRCKAPNDFEYDFWISKIDAVGFLVLSVLLTGPIWAITSLLEFLPIIGYLLVFIALKMAISNKEYKVVALLVAELIIDSLIYEVGGDNFSLLVTTAFLITFIKVGRKIYGFFFLCVNYRFKFKLFCRSCQLVAKDIALPTKS